MSSERRIRASRANGALSRGPITAEGRRRAAQNKIRHGVLAQTIVLDGEDPEAFKSLLAAFQAEFDPATASQSALVETLAAARRRLMRIWAIEKAVLTTEIAKHDPADAPTRGAVAFRSLDLLHRYEAHYNRQYARARRLLKSNWNLPQEAGPKGGRRPSACPAPKCMITSQPDETDHPVPHAPGHPLLANWGSDAGGSVASGSFRAYGTSQIEMQSENLTIVLYRDRAKVTVEYVMKNTADAVDVKAG
ncbi:MAG TPA: hypothetical protein VKU01_34705, partial [Bryobacteraceae bacterium]|nr:hypothetical protein [Bryobacteraceae bacterium]